MPQQKNDIALLAQQDYHLQSLMQGHHGKAAGWALQQQDERLMSLQAWLGPYLKLPPHDAWLMALPAAYCQGWQGWRAYYAGHLTAAADWLHQAFEACTAAPQDQQLKVESALGLGKVYTRTGHWQAGRAWLLHSLDLARRADRQFDIMRGYGALAELLLRAGHVQAAHACMSTAYHLLPAGKGQQAKQLNYLATALMRSRANLRAESLLMTALYMAKDAGDQESRLHALARLQFLRWDTQGADQGDILEELGEQPEHDMPEPPSAPAASGFLKVGRALRALSPSCSDIMLEAGIQALHQAHEAFGSALPMEQAWAQRLACAHGSDGYVTPPEVARCLALESLDPPATVAVLDLTWQQLPMPERNGFHWLMESPSVKQAAGRCSISLADQRQCFFI